MRSAAYMVMAFWLAFAVKTNAQRAQLVALDYTIADSIALNFPQGRYDDPAAVAQSLCALATTPEMKFRIIYRYIAENVEFRYGRNEVEPADVLKKGKCMSEGYANLLVAMCSAVDVPCQAVEGFAKIDPEAHIRTKMKQPNHIWNAVFLHDEWHLVDLGWDAGSFDPRRKKFEKDFKTTYFLADPDVFVQTHYASDPRWNLNTHAIKTRDLKRGAIIYPAAHERGLTFSKWPKGTVGSQFKIQFESESEVNWVTIQLANDRDPRGALLIKKPQGYEIQYRFAERESGPFYVYIDGIAVLAFMKK